MKRENILKITGQNFFTIRWDDDLEAIEIIDQRLLPETEKYIFIRNVDELISAIKSLAIRGAPAIGIAGAMGIAIAASEACKKGLEEADSFVRKEAKRIEQARPTAVNLKWAIKRVLEKWDKTSSMELPRRKSAVIEEAESILLEDIKMCLAIGENGQKLLPENATVMTICNAGALATGGYGTALSVVRAARKAGKNIKVIACETRPLLQGARLTVWELMKDGIDVTLICDSTAAWVMSRWNIDAIITGADRIAQNGDCANKIGTYMLSLSAKQHRIPFYIAAPSSTFDPESPDGKSIIIEERAEEEVSIFAGKRIALSGAKIYNPAFDITPARFITKIITDKGVFIPDEIEKQIGNPKE